MEPLGLLVLSLPFLLHQTKFLSIRDDKVLTFPSHVFFNQFLSLVSTHRLTSSFFANGTMKFFSPCLYEISFFLDAFSHLYKRVCPSVDPSVRSSVGYT